MAKIDCSELAQTISDLAMNISAEKGINTLDDVVVEMKKDTPLINRQIVVDSIVEATEGRSRDTSSLINKLNEIKREARSDKKLQQKITNLERTLEAGETIQPKRRADKSTKALKDLREIRDRLKKKIAKSEPTQKKRLQEQVETLNKRLESGDILPATKPAETPKSKELERLEFKRDELRREIRRRIQDLKPRSIFGQFVQDPFNAARNIMTAFDFSAVLRQGGFTVIGHPIRASKALVPMFKAFRSRQSQERIDKEIRNRPNFLLRMKAGDFHGELDGKLSGREEIIQSKLIDKLEKFIPGLAASNRAYITFLNVLRADSFDVMVDGLSKDGDVTLDEAKAIANFNKTSTGRGSLGKFESAAEGLNVAFFAPRYVASRFQLLLGVPLFGGNARTRKLIAKEYARYLIGMALVYALAALTLDEDALEPDPRSSDFGKIKIGNTRLDPLSGVSQVTVLLSRVASGKFKSSTTGLIKPIRGDDVGFGQTTTTGVIGSFLRYKLSPMFGTTLNLLSGEDPIGRPFGPEDLPKSLLIPLALKEVNETIQEQGLPRGTAFSLLAIFGMGVQTYGSTTLKEHDEFTFRK